MKRLFYIIALLAICAFGGRTEGLPNIPTPDVEAAATDAPTAFTGAGAPYDGAWLPFEDGFKLYLPVGWVSVGLTDAQREAGLFYRAGSEDGAMGLAVGYMFAAGLETVDDLAGDFEAAGYSGVTPRSLNGIPAIGFERPRDGYRGVAFFHPVYPDYALYVYVSPLAPSGDAGRIGEALLASIGPAEMPSEEVSSERLKKY